MKKIVRTAKIEQGSVQGSFAWAGVRHTVVYKYSKGLRKHIQWNKI